MAFRLSRDVTSTSRCRFGHPKRLTTVSSSFVTLCRAATVRSGRMHLIEELERTRDETLQCFSLNRADLARSYAPGKWSVAYILHHLSDSETVFFDRIRRVLSEPRPVL
ncbi:MAG: hypothetical protein DMD66_02490 [Gemmatimonadetes bacterium]|nr:MAG: hypothetical protein DMD66_02490 [Gemmatimonadota bacterium]